MTRLTLHLYKQNFKFSSAHFFIFDEKRAERLHGHNYRVRVDISFATPSVSDQSGFAVDFNFLKKSITDVLEEWDEMVLLPGDHPEMKIQARGANLEVSFRDRFYSFPKSEVCVLPIKNTSVEMFSKILAEKFIQVFKSLPMQSLRVRVEETPGQAASFAVSL